MNTEQQQSHLTSDCVGDASKTALSGHTPRKLTFQQIFDKAALGVIRQGALSKGLGGNCKYRTVKSGKVLACGVGHLIADDCYTPRIEGEAATVRTFDCATGYRYSQKPRRAAQLVFALCGSGVDATDETTLRLLERIQDAHDGSADLDDFIAAMKKIGRESRLDVSRLASIPKEPT